MESNYARLEQLCRTDAGFLKRLLSEPAKILREVGIDLSEADAARMASAFKAETSRPALGDGIAIVVD